MLLYLFPMLIELLEYGKGNFNTCLYYTAVQYINIIIVINTVGTAADVLDQ